MYEGKALPTAIASNKDRPYKLRHNRILVDVHSAITTTILLIRHGVYQWRGRRRETGRGGSGGRGGRFGDGGILGLLGGCGGLFGSSGS